MKPDNIWRIGILIAAGCLAVATWAHFDPGTAIAATVAIAAATSAIELWKPFHTFTRDAYDAFLRSQAFRLMVALHAAAVATLARTFTSWTHRHRAAPGHSWRSCPST